MQYVSALLMAGGPILTTPPRDRNPVQRGVYAAAAWRQKKTMVSSMMAWTFWGQCQDTPRPGLCRHILPDSGVE
jgi:hypothetical protein